MRFRLRVPIAYSSSQIPDSNEQADACAEVPMTLITIKDLLQSDDLDREAMRSIVGGGRTGARPVQIDQAKVGGGRIVDYPPGFGRRGPIPAGLKRPAE
jgi:hypothetical protein